MEEKYMSGQLTATRFLDEASHFFDGWNTHTLQDDWNEAYGAYIQQIEDPRNIDILDAMNEELPEIELPAQPRPVAPGPPDGPAPR
jgi:lysophospholipase L1-like esterase